MRRHPPGWLAWPLAALSLGGLAACVTTVWLQPGLAAVQLSGSPSGYTVEALWLLGAPIVGAVLASRRPDHSYGWLLLSLGLAGTAFEALGTYGVYAELVRAGTLPFGRAAVLVGDLLWGVIVIHVPFLLLLFPDGRLPSPSWRWLVRVIAVLAALLFATGPFLAGQAGIVTVDNPLRVEGTAGAVLTVVLMAAGFGLLGTIAAAASSVFVRRRRAGPQERLQLKWFAYAAGVLGVLTLGSAGGWLIPDPMANAALLTVALNAVFAAIGVAVLRYRLYEIDRIVSRTISYVLLSALLAGVYVIAVMLLSRLLAPFGPSSELAVAAATLAAVAVFAPARRRIQAVVDRRFNRARYDAERVVVGLRERLRDDVELEDVVAATQVAAAGAVQPARASLWLAGREVPS